MSVKHNNINSPDRREFLIQAAGGLAAVSLFPSVLPAAPLRGMAPVQVGLIGAGRQGRAMMTELAKFEAVRIAAVCDNDASRLDSGVKKTKDAASFADHRALLDGAKDLDAVIIATPTHLHKQIALDCMQAGKHIYCEAPIAHTPEDCKAIATAARDFKKVFAVGLEGRSNPVYALARSFFRAGGLEAVVSLRAQAFQKTSWKTPANDPAREKALNWRLDKEVSTGLMGELGTHQIDVMRYFADMEPRNAFGVGDIRVHKDGREVADTVACMMKMSSGQTLSYESSLGNSFGGKFELLHTTAAAFKMAWTHGWMFKEADAATQGWEVYANRQRFHNDEGITLIADATKLASQGKLKDGVGLPYTSLYYALADFVKSVTESKPVAATAEDGMKASIAGILANRAIVSGGVVEIKESDLSL